MGKNKKKEYVLAAVLDEETYMAYKEWSGNRQQRSTLSQGVILA